MRLVNLIFVLCLSFLLASCATPKRDKSIINTKSILEKGKKGMQEMVEMGPKPFEPEFETRDTKRKVITSEEIRNYVTISDEFSNLKQNVSINFNNLDFRYAMMSLGKIGGINILVGDEITGTITAKLDDVPWDKAFYALLDMKSYAADLDVPSGLIRVHSPEKLTQQETFKSQRADALRKKIQLEETVEPVISEIWRLYYISPDQAKKTLEDLFALGSSDSTGGGAGAGGIQTTGSLKITVENVTRSIIVRGRKPDLDVVDKVIREIDVRTRQVLIEAFIIEASDDFERALGSRIGASTTSSRDGKTTTVEGIIGGAAGGSAGVTLGNNAGTVSAFPVAGATSGIGIIKTVGATALKLELTALESEGMSKTLSNPKVFTLNNQKALITQGQEIPYQTTTDGTTSTEFKEAALKLEVTPRVVGDGNVLLDIKVNNDSVTPGSGDEPPINKMEIVTKLLVSDGDIVVIGGVKKNVNSDNISRTPGLGRVPVLGNLFKSKSKVDNLDELLIFIAPRVI